MAIRRPPNPPPTTGLVPGEQPEDVHPIRLARILAEKWANLPDATRQVVLEELADGGIVPESAASGAAKVSSQPGGVTTSKTSKYVKLAPEREDVADLKMAIIRSELKMPPAAQNDPLDLVEVLGLLAALTKHVGFLGDMLNTVWDAWQNLQGDKRIQPSSNIRRPILELLRESLTRPESASALAAALRDQTSATRLFIAILSGLGQGSQAFSTSLSRYLDPDTVIQEVRKSRGGRPPSTEDLWNRYRQLGDSLTPNEIEHRLLQQVVAAAETFYHAAQRG